MLMTKRSLLASGATLALTSVAQAQAPQGSNQSQDVLLDHQAFHLAPTGEARRMMLSAEGAAAVKSHGREMNGHALFYRENGKNYVLHDQPMTDGSMLFSHMADWKANF